VSIVAAIALSFRISVNIPEAELGVHAPSRTQFDIAKYVVDCRQVQRIVIRIGLQKRTVNVKDDCIHYSLLCRVTTY
jgi:hypothetical protein